MPDYCWKELAKAKDLAIYRPCHSDQGLSEVYQLHQNSLHFSWEKPYPVLFGITKEWREGLKAKEFYGI